jgi:hypothetical protein
MKTALLLLILVSSTLVLAGETSTECLKMRDSNERSNKKVSLGQSKIRVTKTKASSQ